MLWRLLLITGFEMTTIENGWKRRLQWPGSRGHPLFKALADVPDRLQFCLTVPAGGLVLKRLCRIGTPVADPKWHPHMTGLFQARRCLCPSAPSAAGRYRNSLRPFSLCWRGVTINIQTCIPSLRIPGNNGRCSTREVEDYLNQPTFSILGAVGHMFCDPQFGVQGIPNCADRPRILCWSQSRRLVGWQQPSVDVRIKFWLGQAPLERRGRAIRGVSSELNTEHGTREQRRWPVSEHLLDLSRPCNYNRNATIAGAIK